MDVLDPIPIDLNPAAIGEALRVEGTRAFESFEAAFAAVNAAAAPRGGYATRYVDERSDYHVVISGVLFESRVLARNFDAIERVFPHVVTIGSALEDALDAAADLLTKYYLDAIGNMALLQARAHLEAHLRSRFALAGLSFMSPGSLEDWPLEQQKPLFAVLGEQAATSTLGVRLNPNCLMVPMKSVSGIYFPTETRFYNCQLCPRDTCMGRKAAYSSELAAAYGVNR